ncbi:hypothetical protein IWW45_008660 [Coemansia sp. RSA 485]|nr:hypothetical protein IWW45_008660 [Coemansia sp. RSA 485]
MVSRLRKFELGTCGKYGIDEINSMHKYAIESVILKLGSLHFHETDEPSIAAAYGDQLSYMKVPQETGAANKVVSAENLAIIKALLKYTVHKRLFRQSTDAHMLFLSLPLQAQSVISSFSDTEMCLWMLVCKHGSTMIEYIGTCISRILDTYIKEANNLDAEDYGYLLAHGAIPKGYSAKILKRIVEDICLLPSKTNAKKAAVALPSKQPSIPEHRRSSVSITSNINITNVLDQLIKDADTASTCNTRTPEEAIPLSASTSSLVFSETKHIPLSLPTSSTINIPLVNTTRRRRASITRPDIGSARHYKPPSARSVSLSLPQTLSLNLLEDFLQKP